MDLQTEHAIPTRYSLLKRLQDWQDNESWQDFFDTYWRLIYSMALRSGLTETEEMFDLYALRQWPVNKVAQTPGVSVPRVYLAKHRVAAMIKREILALEKGRR
jgi:hypothetical protein